MKQITYVDVGATLFIPATHKSLIDVVCHNKYEKLKSVLIDTEDGVDENSLEASYQAIKFLLSIYEKKELLVFIRPRDVKLLKRLLEEKNIDNIDGFILPKFSLENAKEYLSLLHKKDFLIMPSIEGLELFDQKKLYKLRDILLPHIQKIPLLRYGLEDMLKELGMRRNSTESIFDYAVASFVLGQLIAVFKSAGFAISGGVFPFFTDNEAFKRDVKRDLKEGLFGKTIIHPSQIESTNELYKVTQEEYQESIEILESTKSVFNQNSKMAETKTMSVFAKEILLRKEVYGLVQ
jgi:citrate lyase beta subunit